MYTYALVHHCVNIYTLLAYLYLPLFCMPSIYDICHVCTHIFMYLLIIRNFILFNVRLIFIYFLYLSHIVLIMFFVSKFKKCLQLWPFQFHKVTYAPVSHPLHPRQTLFCVQFNFSLVFLTTK